MINIERIKSFISNFYSFILSRGNAFWQLDIHNVIILSMETISSIYCCVVLPAISVFRSSWLRSLENISFVPSSCIVCSMEIKQQTKSTQFEVELSVEAMNILMNCFFIMHSNLQVL